MQFGSSSLILMYLISIVLANVLLGHFGPWFAPINAFLFIGLDLTARDRLHDAWHGGRLVVKMGLLILAGSLISYFVNRDLARIAAASFLSFAAASSLDFAAYHILRDRSWMVRANGSNVVGAAADSFIFPILAFGPGVGWTIIASMMVAKIVGGWFWSLILRGDKE